MNTIRPISTARATADFFTGSYRFSATVQLYKRTLVDLLSDPVTDHLDLIDVYVSRINNPGNIVGTYPKGALIKSEINFVLLSSEADSISKERFYAPNRTSLPIFLTIPSFELEGKFQWLGAVEVRKILGSGDGQKFLTILEARAANSIFPKVMFHSPAVLVNKSKIEMLCLGGE